MKTLQKLLLISVLMFFFRVFSLLAATMTTNRKVLPVLHILESGE